MFRRRTLFILGAGSSKEVRLPTGPELISSVAEKLSFRNGGHSQLNDQDIFEALVNYLAPNNARPLLDAREKITAGVSHFRSIDDFVHAHSDDELVALWAKFAIAKVIIQAEQASPLFINIIERQSRIDWRSVNDTWYAHFFKLLREGVGRADADRIFANVAIVSYNYDRTIEQYLYRALQDAYSFDEERAADIMRSLMIFHPYGTIGLLPWQGGNWDFGMYPGFSGLPNLASAIRTFNDEVNDEHMIRRVRDEVLPAQTIVFLGFGFHQQNMLLLDPGSECTAGMVYATGHLTSQPDRTVFDRRIRNMLHRTNAATHIEPVTCSTFLKDYGLMLAS